MPYTTSELLRKSITVTDKQRQTPELLRVLIERLEAEIQADSRHLITERRLRPTTPEKSWRTLWRTQRRWELVVIGRRIPDLTIVADAYLVEEDE